MTRLHLYREYRRIGLRRAWSLSGMGGLAWRVAAAVAIGLAIAAAASAAERHVRAINDAADRRVAAQVTDQSKLIASLSKFLAACLGPREGVIWIGGEAHFCKAVSTGIKR